MIITKQDCYKLLMGLNEKGIDVNSQMQYLMKQSEVDQILISFINSNRPLDITNFYNKIRKDNNNNKSKLYINLMKDIEDINEILITLSSLSTQILIYGKNLEGSNRKLFYQQSKLNNIQEAIRFYIEESNDQKCLELIKNIKADIKILEKDIR